MTQYPFRAFGQKPVSPARDKIKHPLGNLDPARWAKHLVLFQPNERVLNELIERANGRIPGLTNAAIVAGVFAHNPDCIWTIARKRNFDPQHPTGEGFIAMLPLTGTGLKLLASNLLDTKNPDLAYICRPGEKPAGLYIWATFAPGPLAAGVALFMEKMAKPPYAGVNLYTWPNTDEGRRFNESLGLKKGAKIGPVYASHLYEYTRAPQAVPLYDSFGKDAGEQAVTITVVRNLDDMMRVISIRSAVYIGEQACPYDEEFDGNDFAATHLLGYVGSEPAGSLRLRFFADFAKVERLAVRKEFRHTRLAFTLVKAGMKLCQAKGYRRLYGHAQTRLIEFWGRFGFRPIEGTKEFVFSDFDYVEGVAEVDKDPDAITIGCDPYVIIRPEGRWHIPGVLERSAARPVTRPSVAEK